jgi:hypothetical protein
MTDRRDPEAEELRALIADLESTLVELRGELDESGAAEATIPRGFPGAGRPAPRPPRLSEVLRFTEEYTIPTLISVLETNIRLLRLGGAALRALDPERSTVRDRGDNAVNRAIDAGRGLSTDRLADGLSQLNDAVAGTEASDPEARKLLSDAEELSAEIQDRLREAGRSGRSERSNSEDDAVHIDVTRSDEDTDDGEDADRDEGEESDDAPEPDVDAELDSIREEVRGSAKNDGKKEEPEDGDDSDGTAPE